MKYENELISKHKISFNDKITKMISHIYMNSDGMNKSVILRT